MAYNGMETYLTLFVQNVMGMGKDIASRIFLAVSAAFLISAVPAGYVARRFGRKRTILAGIACMALLCGCMTSVRSLAAVYALMVAGGIGWALININSYPMVIELAGPRVGAYTGFYYFFSMCAASVSPVMVGGLMDAVEALQRRGLVNNAYVPEEILFPVVLCSSYWPARACFSFVMGKPLRRIRQSCGTGGTNGWIADFRGGAPGRLRAAAGGLRRGGSFGRLRGAPLRQRLP
jgi:MFS family permease